MESIKRIIDSYEKWVASNPETIYDLENATKFLTYFLAGRIPKSSVISELGYAASNLFVFYNDRILEKANEIKKSGDGNNNMMANSCDRLKIMLTTLEYSEVFIEISARKLFGNAGKWILVAIIQMVKAAGRFFILRHSTEIITRSPPLPSLNRRKIIEKHKKGLAVIEPASYTFRLKRSGRIVRKVEGAPPINCRDFDLSEEIAFQDSSNIPKKIVYAEYLYIAKPLIHLTAMGLLGQKRWKQYLIALAIDFISIRAYYQCSHLMTTEQKVEMSKRCVHLLLYLVRSPLYEVYTERRLNNMLGYVANNVPIVRLIAKPLKDYLPQWQNTYFYLWST